MREKDIPATCVPSRFDGDDWACAFFFHVAGPESKQDRRILKKSEATPMLLQTELMKHPRAAVAMLRTEIRTILKDPLVFEILLVPGQVNMHYECLKLLAGQSRIRFVFADSDYRVIREQQYGISDVQHGEFEAVAREAFAHDSLLRMAGNYDAGAAVAEIVSHYQPRMEPCAYRGVRTN